MHQLEYINFPTTFNEKKLSLVKKWTSLPCQLKYLICNLTNNKIYKLRLVVYVLTKDK